MKLTLSLGRLESIQVHFLSLTESNMTLGIHCQEWENKEKGPNGDTREIMNQVYIGFFLFRIELSFIKQINN